MLSNATSTAWINQHQRKGRQGEEEDDRSLAVRTGSGQRRAGTKGRREVDARSRQRIAPLAGKSLGTVGSTVKLTTVGAPALHVTETKVTRADAPKVLEYNWGDFDIRWELEVFGGGTRLTLWTNIDRAFISMGAAGWHICLDVLD